MKIYLMTDLEGVCGVANFEDWCVHPGRYYEEGKKLLTLEVNAAAEGLFEAGADEVWVIDGHGPGGVNHPLLDARTVYLRGFPFPNPWPCGLDPSFDAMVWVGQHAKAGTESAHIPHTQNFSVIDWKINGISVGELGQIGFCGAVLGVRPIFASGDFTLTEEAKALFPGIETVSVKRGLMPGPGDEADTEAYRRRNYPAVHLHPTKARNLIRKGAFEALSRFKADPGSFTLKALKPPFRRNVRYRATQERGPREGRAEHPSDLFSMMNMPDEE